MLHGFRYSNRAHLSESEVRFSVFSFYHTDTPAEIINLFVYTKDILAFILCDCCIKSCAVGWVSPESVTPVEVGQKWY